MKKILGLDLGTTSIGWAVVNEAENKNEQSSIVRLGVRVNPLSTDEQTCFEKGKPITTNADRTLKRGMRRNLQRYKLRREELLKILKERQFITDDTVLSENGNHTTFETYRLRAKSATEEVTLEQFARILLMINKKRGYKSSRKAKSDDEGQLIDGMSVAKSLYEEGITPGQFSLRILESGKKYTPDYYRSDLQDELNKIWSVQSQHYPEFLTAELRLQLEGRGRQDASKLIYAKYGISTAENKNKDKRLQACKWRVQALESRLDKEVVASVICDLCGAIKNCSGYLGAIGDRSKELYFKHLTVGQYQMKKLDADPHYSLTNQVFYRQDYLDEFERIWETQAQFHKELTPDLKKLIRDVVIFYQRPLRSQKGLISFCELESRQIEVTIDGKKKVKTAGSRVCPKSSPLFQEFKIWQRLNDVVLSGPSEDDPSVMGSRCLDSDEKQTLFNELSYKDSLTKSAALKLLFTKTKGLDLNFDELEGNRTQAALFSAYQRIVEASGHGEYNFAKISSADALRIVNEVFPVLGIKTDFLTFHCDGTAQSLEKQPLFQLWHLLYSFEGDGSKTGDEHLVSILHERYGFAPEYAKIIASVAFQDDYGSLSSKAMLKILPYLQAGNGYSDACALAGYRHSKNSLTREEIDAKVLKEKLELLPKNSLRNPVVEKILNQMVNVVNAVIDTYGRPDEVRIELARELKKNAAERKLATESISKNTKDQERIRQILTDPQGCYRFTHVSRTDIVRYRLYEELASRGFKTLYSNTYIPKEDVFSKKFDIEHIIPQSRLFDDSFSNKTLEARDINIEKGNATAYDYVLEKYGDEGASQYLASLDALLKADVISRAKYNKLKMRQADIPDDFIERDLRNTQYISRKAQEMLGEVVREVLPTTGSVTDRLREDWQLVNVMQELNWDKYAQLGLTQTIEGRDGQQIRRITDWTKRNDHRHHAMDALTIAFTKRSFIQYLNNLNARSDKSSSIYGIEQNSLYRDKNGHLLFLPPMPLDQFRAEAKRQLESVLVSIKAKNKVVTRNTNVTRKRGGTNHKVQLTPRAQLHNETIYGSMQVRCGKEVAVGSKLTAELIAQVPNADYRNALRMRLEAFGGDPKKAFTGKNSLEKNPIFLDEHHTQQVPASVRIAWYETQYTIRKKIDKDLKIDKVVDEGVKRILQARLDEYGGDANKAFSNLDENPIWLNREKGIDIKSVTITGVSNAVALHDKHDKEGRPILGSDGQPLPADYVNTSNNHHVAIYRDAEGNLQEHVVSFYEATERVMQGLPIIDKHYREAEGWKFLFTMKQNEYFVFPASDFNPEEVDLLNPNNYALISPHLYRVQKMTSKDYFFRHHLETNVDDNKELKGITWKRLSLNGIGGIVKVRIDHIGRIVAVGEY